MHVGPLELRVSRPSSIAVSIVHK